LLYVAQVVLLAEMMAARRNHGQESPIFLRVVALGFICALGLLVSIGVEIYRTITDVKDTHGWVTHSHQTIEALESLQSHMIDIETGQRGYVLTGQEPFLAPYASGLEALGQDRRTVRVLLLRDGVRSGQIDELETAIDDKLHYVEQIITKRKSQGLPSLTEDTTLLEGSRKAMERIRMLIQRLRERAEARLDQRIEDSDEGMRDLFTSVMTGKVVTVVILSVMMGMIWRETLRRRAAQCALEQAHAELEGRVAERTAQISQMNVRLVRLSRKVLEAQEAERRRVARDLHDEIGQALMAINLNLQGAQGESPRVSSEKLIADALAILKEVSRAVRNLALDLRPSLLDELGLSAAAKWYIKRQGERVGWQTDFVLEGWSEEPPYDISITGFRILQEALTNAAKHADATSVKVTLSQQSGVLFLMVRDNGVGFDPAAMQVAAQHGGSLGLLSMQERASLMGGSLTVTSSAYQGTCINATLPINSVSAPIRAAGVSS
jgi:signal transduction histidine kinase